MLALKQFVCLAAFATTALATAAQIGTDIGTISSKTSALNTALDKLVSPGTFVQALNVHNEAKVLLESINKANTDALATAPLTVAEATNILQLVQFLVPLFVNTLDKAAAKKPVIVALNSQLAGTTKLVLSDLRSINGSTVAFENTLVARTPHSVVTQAQGSIRTVNAALARVIALYAS